MGRRLLSARCECEDNRAKRQAVKFLTEPCCVLTILTMTPRRFTTTPRDRSTMAIPLDPTSDVGHPHHVVAGSDCISINAISILNLLYNQYMPLRAPDNVAGCCCSSPICCASHAMRWRSAQASRLTHDPGRACATCCVGGQVVSDRTQDPRHGSDDRRGARVVLRPAQDATNALPSHGGTALPRGQAGARNPRRAACMTRS